MKNPITHFEIPADNVERAKKFYEKIFDWKIEKYDKDDDYWFVMTTEVGEDEWTPKEPGAINGGLVKRDKPNEPFINYITVDSIDTICKSIEKNGGKIIVPKTQMGEWGWWATFKDTEGNIIGLYEESEK
jgi:predicted enzyme related to lactoylglutathione lyase